MASGDEFYKKLVELKTEQKKTLEYMKELYNQKQILKNEIEKSEQNFNDLRMSVNKPLDPQMMNFERNTISAYDTNNVRLNEINEIRIDTHKNFVYENEIPTSSDCKICVETHRHKTGIDSYQNHQKPPLPTSVKSEEFFNEKRLVEGVDDNLLKIEQMWDRFNLDDYNRANNNNNNNKFNELRAFDERPNSKVSFAEDWAYKVTIPKPFNLTQTSGKKSKRQLQVEEELRRKEEAELDECNKQFRATPMPSHVSKPIYEEKKREEELRKLRLRLESKEYLESVPRPFKLTERRHSFSGQTELEEDIIQDFTANPLPEFYFDNEYLSER